jgi:polyhydroxyalkanoate synthesis regulator phasin
MSRIDDLRKTIETMLGNLTPAKAQQMAKGMAGPDAAKEQVARLAGDLLEWSQKNRERLRNVVRGEIRDQLRQSGVATQAELDALKKRVRELERAAGMTASGRAKGIARAKGARAKGATKASASPAAASKKTASAARRAPAAGRTATAGDTSTGAGGA